MDVLNTDHLFVKTISLEMTMQDYETIRNVLSQIEKFDPTEVAPEVLKFEAGILKKNMFEEHPEERFSVEPF